MSENLKLIGHCNWHIYNSDASFCVYDAEEVGAELRISTHVWGNLAHTLSVYTDKKIA